MAKGFTEAAAMLDRIPQEARGRLGYLLAELGMEVSAAQKAAVPQKTGFLKGGLDVDLMLEEMRMQAGLLAFRRGRNSRYYGRFVNFGRRAQSVTVVRGTTQSKSHSAKKRRKKGLTLRKPYTLRVPAMAPREFIDPPGVDNRVSRRLADFWSEVVPA